MKPMSGSTSRRMATSRMARRSIAGMTTPLSDDARRAAISTVCSASVPWTTQRQHAEDDALQRRSR